MILVSDSGPYRTRDNAGLFQKGAFHRSGRLEFFETGYQGSYGRKLYTRTNQVKMCLPEKNERGNLLNLQEFAFQRVRTK